MNSQIYTLFSNVWNFALQSLVFIRFSYLIFEMKYICVIFVRKKPNLIPMFRHHFIMSCLVLLFAWLNGHAQEVVSGKSRPTKLTLTPEYERGLPPILYADLYFEDDNNNSILEATEKAHLTITIRNEGKGKAQGLIVSARDLNYDKALKIGSARTIPFLLPDQSIQVVFPFEAGRDLRSSEHEI